MKKIIPSSQELTGEQCSLITPELINYADTLAQGYRGCGVEIKDLQAEARRGLCEAALRFDASQGASLKTYATFHIRKYILLAIEQYGCIFRLNREERQELKIVSIDARLTERIVPGEYDPDDSPEADDEWLDQALSDCIEDPEAEAERQQQDYEEQVQALLEVLDPKEREVIELIHGLHDREHTVREVAEIMHLQPARVRQLYNRAINKMQLSAEAEE